MSKKANRRNRNKKTKRRTNKRPPHRSRARSSSARSLPDKDHGIYYITSQSELTAVQRSGRPTIIDFWAPWCMPCRRLAPIFEKMAGKYGERINFAKIDVQAHPQLGGKYSVRSIPAMMVFRGEKVVHTQVGLVDERRLSSLVERFLPPEPKQPATPSSSPETDEDEPDWEAREVELIEDDDDMEGDVSAEGESTEDDGDDSSPSPQSSGFGGRLKRWFGREKHA